MPLGEWWRKLEHPAWTGIGVISATLIGIAGIWIVVSGGGSPSSPPEDPPRNVLEQIEQSDRWVEPPTIFDSADDTIPITGGIARSVAAVTEGDVIALTPEELLDDALSYEGVPIYAVGRVVDRRAVSGEFGMEDEVQLVSADGSVAYVGSASFLESEGDLIYALGRIAAVGRARLSSGRIVEAVYFLSLNPSGGTDFDTESVEFDDPEFRCLSRSIQSAAIRAVGKRPAPTHEFDQEILDKLC